ncbi:MAG TPA: rhomboid family intramembrane serine protease [Chitinophagaceae bacterium]|mgnify:CR=1 FL=1|nr:MAG: rhomboid family protein [Bacteroidetes bacterium OLB11]HMN32736.1 rhomboid family intramembrane serine protease [Chitinophagaceae bacterium]
MEHRPMGNSMMPPVVKNLLIINTLVFFATIVFAKIGYASVIDSLALHHWSSDKFRVWQLITHLFVHGGDPNDPEMGFLHLFSNMFALWMFGGILENYFGSKRFLTFYMICGVGAAILYLLVLSFQYSGNMEMLNYFSAVGASGAVFGILFAFGYLFPNTILQIYFLFPVKAKYFVAFYALFELYAGVKNNVGDNVAHFAHLGGMVVAFILIKYWNNRDKKHFY